MARELGFDEELLPWLGDGPVEVSPEVRDGGVSTAGSGLDCGRRGKEDTWTGWSSAGPACR